MPGQNTGMSQTDKIVVLNFLQLPQTALSAVSCETTLNHAHSAWLTSNCMSIQRRLESKHRGQCVPCHTSSQRM